MQNEINAMLSDINKIENVTQEKEEEIEAIERELEHGLEEREEQGQGVESDDDLKFAEQVFKPDIQFDTFYDIEIQCESILQLTAGQGWSVKIMSEQYERKRQVASSPSPSRSTP